MAITIDLLQAKNAGIAGVGTAPTLANYPTDGNIKALTFPVVLSWLRSGTLDNSGSILRGTYDLKVYVAKPGVVVWDTAKQSCDTLLKAFITAYNPTSDNEWLQAASNPVKMIRGSLSFTGYEQYIAAPDGEPFHGFIVSIDVDEHVA